MPEQEAAAAAPPRPRSFLVGTQRVDEGGDFDHTYSLANARNADPWALTATGWLRGLQLLITGTGLTAGTPAADAPFNLFSNIELDDVNNEAIFGPFDGYTAYLTNKYGGYLFADDPGTNCIYALSGTNSANNFTYMLYIPLEVVARDPLGAVPSVNNTAALTLKMALNAQSTIFTTPTGTLSVRIQGTQQFYWEPKETDKQGRAISPEPPASGTTQYWTQGSIAIAGSGTINSPLPTGLGYPFRCYAFLLRDASGSRANGETNWPDPLVGLKFEANMLRSQYPKLLWQAEMGKSYGYTNSAMDERGAGNTPGKENGVYMLNWNKDFAFDKPGSETRRSYLVTSPGSNFIFNGAIGGAGNLYSVVNYIAPGGGQGKQNTAALTGGQ
jgi:hypothetical protein